jgi:rubrerythrin
VGEAILSGEIEDGQSRHPRRWSLADIPFGQIDRAAVADDRRLFYLVAAASFIEITSDTYTRNLIEFCAGEDEVVDWLENGWQHEEVQHGAALRRYVETAWPAFDWDGAYRSFHAEYMHFCGVEMLAPTRSLEMVARCVVETGTSRFYRMLSDASQDPVLRRLAGLISVDEVQHYKNFYRFFRLYANREHPSRVDVMRQLLHRLRVIDSEDASIAFKHVRLSTCPDEPFLAGEYDAFRRSVRPMARRHYRFEPAVKMLLRPLRLSGLASRVAVPLGTAIARRSLFA